MADDNADAGSQRVTMAALTVLADAIADELAKRHLQLSRRIEELEDEAALRRAVKPIGSDKP